MVSDFETLNILINFATACGAVLALSKISREASADRLRRTLRGIEIELFEIALSRGLLRNFAVVLLNHEIRRAYQTASAIHWRQWGWTALRGESDPIPVIRTFREMEDQLRSIPCPQARARIENLAKRARGEVRSHLMVGTLPFASAVCGAVLAKRQRDGLDYLQSVDGPAASRGEGVQLPRAA